MLHKNKQPACTRLQGKNKIFNWREQFITIGLQHCMCIMYSKLD